MKKDAKSLENKPEIISFYEFFRRFPDEKTATAFFESRRWKGAPCCPFCASKSVAKITSGKPMPYRCRACRKHFSVRTGTVLAESKLPLHTWLMAIYMLHTARKGVSSIQMAKQLGITQKSAWFLDHRIREAMKQRGGILSGTVEADETFIGGLEKNKHLSKRLHKGTGGTGKAAVFGMRSRDGQTQARVIKSVRSSELHRVIKESIRHGATLYTDSWVGYNNLRGYRHTVIKLDI